MEYRRVILAGQTQEFKLETAKDAKGAKVTNGFSILAITNYGNFGNLT